MAEGGLTLGLTLQPDSGRYTLPHFLADVAARHRDRVALHFEERTLSFDELEREARRWARALVAGGVVKGARVAVWMANRPEWAIAVFGASLAGAVVIPVNTFATAVERDYILRHSDASVLLMQPQLSSHRFAEELADDHPEIAQGRAGRILCRALPQLRRVVCLGDAPARGAIESVPEFLKSADEVSDGHLDAIAREILPADDALVIYTSGTTAHPKGVLHRQRAPVIQSWRFAEGMGLSTDDVVYSAQPLFWTAGMCMSLGACLAAGATLILEELFEPGRALGVAERLRATAIFAWPHQEKAMAEHPSAIARDLSAARKVEFDSPLAPLVGLEKDEWGTHGAYGSTETFTISSFVPASAPAALRTETSGKPLPGMTFRVVAPDSGEVLGPGESGEIAVKGATLMAGYYKVEPEFYLDADGFFRTQDGGSLDEDGTLHWTGRISGLIKTGGANVSPLEIEQALQDFPGLRAGLAVGVPHPMLGEAIVLCAVATEGAQLDAEALRASLRGRLSAYKIPKRVLLFSESELSFTGSQKIQVAPLREKALARLEAEAIEIDGFVYGSGDRG